MRIVEPERLTQALRRAKTAILTVAAVYAFSVAVGIVMVHAGSSHALDYRDRLVARAQAQDRASIEYRQGHLVKAALWDFMMNTTVGAVPQTITGLTVVSPYAFAAYRGWVGGIVSVDKEHKSRFRSVRSGAYYLITLILQLIPYSLAGGIGVHLGLSYFKRFNHYTSEKILGYPQDALKDVAIVYCLIVPLFLIASLWEFLSPWN